jgi:dihydrofolate reductase
MGKLIVSEFITLDGVVESPGPSEEFEHAGWSFAYTRGAEGDKFKYEELMAADAQLLGRVTYEGFANAWPGMTGAGEFGEKMNGMPKYVVSTTLSDEDAHWNNSTVIRSDVAGEVAQIKDRHAGEILVGGSGELAQSLAMDDLVDEYRLMVFPLALGSGKRLFGERMPRTGMRLLDSKPVGPDGIVILTYEPTR